MSTHANAAKQIRKELKENFPKTNFRVTSKTYSGGNSIRIYWIDGPTTKEVNKISGKYEYGHFDGMTDCYEMSNCRDDISQVKFVFNDRTISNSVNENVFKMLQESYSFFDKVSHIDETSRELLDHWSVWSAREYVSRIVRDLDLSEGFKKERIA